MTSVHIGLVESIPASCTPGLALLPHFISALDSLASSPPPELYDLIAPTTYFSLNGTRIPTPFLEKAEKGMFPQRAARLSKFFHTLEKAWDVEEGEARRTVFSMSESTTVFKADESREEVKVKELSAIVLERKVDAKFGWVVVEMMSWFDPAPVANKKKSLETAEVKE
ncbi:hypothetical protein BT69DRAFT_1283564 [Atractiella rhizophila]|nr:hypothetical protein BT69DRAFT_1283564 [Atractiella rhizophila]